MTLDSLKLRFSRLLVRVQPSETTVLLTTAIVVGVGAGVGAIIFRWLIGIMNFVAFTWLPQVTSGLGRVYVVLAPAIGGLIVGPLIYFFAREAKGHGVPEVMEAVALRGGRIRPIVAVIKSLASSISIGSGGSVGREGPIVQIGSALGSTVGQALHLSDDRVRNLIACGAAGGIAATFNAPIAGVFFALEIILGDFSIRHFGSVVFASVMASVIGRVVFGDIPAFIVPEYAINSLWEFPFYAALGALAALAAVVYTRLIYWAEDLFAAWKSVPEWIQPAVGGVLLGLVALAYGRVPLLGFETMPQIFGVGYPTIEGGLHGELGIAIMLALMALKIVSTALTLGSGASGGVFAPGLFIGSMLGGAFGLLIERVFPGLPAPAGAYALVGMGALFAGATHAPITAVIILFELTGDYRIILPLMLAVVVSTLVGQRLLNRESIYTLKLTRRGVRLERGRDVDILQGVTVGEVMVHNVETVSTNFTLVELSDLFIRTHRHGLPVLNEQGKLWGIVTVADLDRAVVQGLPRNTTVAAIGTPHTSLVVAFPDETIGDVLGRMGPRGLGRLPVVARDDANHLVGLIRRHDIIRAYNMALSHRAELQHRVKRAELSSIKGTEFIDLKLAANDKAIGTALKDLACDLPQDCILISIRREGNVVIPHGNTVFQAGDLITAFIRSKDAETMHKCLRG